MTNSVHRPVRSKFTCGYNYRGISIMKYHGDWVFTRYNMFNEPRGLDSWYVGMANLKSIIAHIDELINAGHIVNNMSLWSSEAIEYANRTK